MGYGAVFCGVGFAAVEDIFSSGSFPLISKFWLKKWPDAELDLLERRDQS